MNWDLIIGLLDAIAAWVDFFAVVLLLLAGVAVLALFTALALHKICLRLTTRGSWNGAIVAAEEKVFHAHR